MEDHFISFGAVPRQIDKLLAWPLGDRRRRGPETLATPAVNTHEGQIGRYRVLAILGEGGMGIVYLAERDNAARERVALKVIKPGADFLHVQARFETERRALVLSRHPNIAKVFDVGTTAAGRPYFAMEYVKGLSITEHCDRMRLTIAGRLALFRPICDAVQHVHEKGILHRDIKPSNILVSANDDAPLPKIIDFGAAKIVSRPLTQRTLLTEDIPLVGTPAYMSPEQAGMEGEDVDVRSDVYSLGVLLYVLLAGVFPYERTAFRQGNFKQLGWTISHAGLRIPSVHLSRLGQMSEQIAKNRRTQVTTLIERLHRGLEWIPLKAMRKERSQRYSSASQLAADIDRYLSGVPLLAEPPTA